MNEKLTANIVPPMAMTDQELTGILNFANENGLDEICKLVAELKTLRKVYLEQCERLGRLEGTRKRMEVMINDLEPDPNKRYAAEMENITDATPKP